MAQDAEAHAERVAAPTGRRLGVLSLAALGIVYGDIGTSPLYAVRECFSGHDPVPVVATNILGVLSLIFWALLLVISIEYVTFILRADNRGEGGILALAALVTPVRATAERRQWIVITLGLFGAALLYADGMITPAISVLSAVEGLKVATPLFERYVVPITVAILIGLFLFQARGTAGVGAVFGPVILLWFTTLGVMGLWYIVHEPSVLRAAHPAYAIDFFRQNGWGGFAILGTVFLVVTGGEALYADIGHFGKRPIRLAWFTVVLPGLLLNYFGQGAFLLSNPAGAVNPFFEMAPEWALYPLVVLAMSAAVIASQAVITGSFSLTLQAVQLGYVPRLRIEHTSEEQRGQIYIPAINWGLMLACIALVLGFRSSSNLAAAYGVAIAITMVITTTLFFVLVRSSWKWPLVLVIVAAMFFLSIDLSFLGANLLKIGSGGWFPLLVAGVGYLLMSTWRKGRQLLAARLRERLIPVELFLAELLSNPPPRVPGTAVFMSGNPIGTPPALRHNVIHNKVLHETVVILSVETAEIPHVPHAERLEVEQIGEGFWRIVVRYGFMEEPHIPRTLASVREPEFTFSADDVSYFLGRETILPTSRPGMSLWRENLFTWMSRNAQTATRYFNLPPERVVELGVQVEL
ncbi:MAG: potassium transporter Kup [Planctomycetes bacterium]|nr:potassium transporter Kup [Planctomycetota bacterium]